MDYTRADEGKMKKGGVNPNPPTQPRPAPPRPASPPMPIQIEVKHSFEGPSEPTESTSTPTTEQEIAT